jgi:hypothetical protein
MGVLAMKASWNSSVWVGLVLVLAGIASYPFYFIRFAALRDFPWVNLPLIALGLVLLGVGIARAFRRPDAYRGKVFGSVLGILTLALSGFFCFELFVTARQLPASHGAPQVGQTAPDFTLPDSKNNPVNLSGMVHSAFAPRGAMGAAIGADPTAATLLIFYRGYW